jgi:multiple sugar transport system permease protein
MSTLELDRPAPGRYHAPMPVNRPPMRRRIGGIARAVAIALVLIVLLFPLLWMLLASLKTSLEVVDPSRVLNFTPTLDNYRNVVAQGDFLRFVGNSFLVAAAATLVSLVVGVPAAYAIARYRVAHATTFLLMARIIPGVSLLVPWYFLFAQIQLVGTYSVLVLTHVFVAMPLVVAITASFVEGLPVELEEAGLVDGLPRIGAFLRVTLPLSTPGIATAAILSFIFSWNNFLFALVLSDQTTRTLPVAIANFTAYASVDWGGLMAASVLITVPVMAIALLAQRYVVSGLTAGATKG